MIAASVARSPTLSRARVPHRASASASASRVVLARAVNVGTSKSQEDMGGLGGDIGARDPTAGEIESGFTSKVLGHADTCLLYTSPSPRDS